MNLVKSLASLFGQELRGCSLSESNVELLCVYSVVSPTQVSAEDIKQALKAFPDRDQVEISCRIEDADPVNLSSRQSQVIKSFLQELDCTLQVAEDTDFTLQIKVSKTVCKNAVSVYSLASLVDFWEADGLIHALKRIQSMEEQASCLLVDGLDNTYRTNNFVLLPFDGQCKPLVSIDKAKRNEQRDWVGHFANAASYGFVPEDFHFDKKPPQEDIALLFEQLKLITSLVYLCDFSHFSEEDEIVQLKLNGYRLFSQNIATVSTIDIQSAQDYFDIYQWVFNDGNLIDKAGLARNIISLHVHDNDLLKLEKGTLQSIKSGFKIYLKENVKQYIEIKNKLSEFVQSSSDKASDIVRTAGSYYKNSIWTMYSFFISVFLLRAFRDNDGMLITGEIYLLFLVFCIVTLLAMNYAIKEIEEEKQRFIDGYQSLKNRYKDLLLPEDLSKILDNDQQFYNDQQYIDDKKKRFRFLWGASLSIIFVLMTLLLAVEYHP